MAFCNIKIKQAQGLANIIAKDVANKRNAGTPYNIEESMRYVYDLMIENGQDKDRAITMAALVPKAVIAQVGQYAPNGAYLAPVLGQVGELVTKAANFETVIEVMGLQGSFTERLKALEDFESNEVYDEEVSIESIPLETIVKTTPQVSSGLSTTMYEEKDAAEDPAVKANGAFIRKFIRLGEYKSKNVSEGFVLNNVNQYRLALVSTEQIPEDSKVIKKSVYGPVVYAFINEQGNIVQDENGHTPHAFLRKIEDGPNGRRFETGKSGNSRLQINAKNAQESGVTLEQFKKQINNQIAFLDSSTKSIIADKNKIIPLEANRGTLGVVTNSKSIRLNSITEFDLNFLLPEGTGSGTSRIVSTERKGKVFQALAFNHPNYDYTLIAQPLPLNETEYGAIAKEILLSKEISFPQKRDLLINVLQKQNVELNDDSIKLNGKTIDLTNPLAAEKLVEDFINTSYINLPIRAGQELEFEGPVRNNLQFEIGNISLAKYVYNNFKTYAKTDEQGRLITPHPVLYYKAPIQEVLSDDVTDVAADQARIQEDLKSLEAEKAEGSMTLDELQALIPEDSVTNLDEVFGRKRKGLNKVDTLTSEATQAEIKEAREWYSKSPLAKVIPVEKWFDIVNSGKVAEFTANAIKLYAGSNYTDLYHEGWHGFSQLFLSKGEKVKLYNAVRNVYGNISYLEAEEILAEDFRKYRLSNGKEVLGKQTPVRNIFKKIYDFLKALFGNMETKVAYREMVGQEKTLNFIKESYDVLYRGEFEDRTADIDNSFFLTLNKGVEGANGKVLSAKDSKDISDAMDSIVSSIIRDYQSSPKEVLSKDGALEALYNEVFKTLKESFNTLKDNNDVKAAVSLGTALSNFGNVSSLKENDDTTLLGYHLKTSRYLESLAKSEDITALLDLDIVDNVEDYMSYYDKGGNEVSIKDLADNSVLYAVRSMRVFDSKGQPIKDRFGFDKLAEFSKSWNRLSTILKEKYLLNEMIAEIKNKSQKEKSFTDLIAVLGDKPSSNDEYKYRMQTSFWQAFNKAYVPIHVTYLQSQVDIKSGQAQDLNVRVKRAEGENSQGAKNLTRKFQANTKLANTRELNGTRILDVNKVLDNYKGITTQNVVRFYKDMGVLPEELENSVVNYLLTPTILVNTNSLVVNLKKQLASLEAGQSTANPISYLSSDQGVYRGMRSTLNNIVEEYSASVGDTGSGRKINAKGTTEYDSTLNSTVTKVIQSLNSAESLEALKLNPSTYFLHPDNNPAMEVNPILNKLFIMGPKDSVGYGLRNKSVKLNLLNVSGVSFRKEFTKENELVRAVEGGKKNISLDSYSKLNQDIHTLFMGGYVENVRNSDKATSVAWKISTEKALINPADVINNTYKSKSFDVFAKMLAGELATMKSYDGVELNAFNSKGAPVNMTDFKIFSNNLIVDESLKNKLISKFQNKKPSALEIYEYISKEDLAVRESLEAGIQRLIETETKKLSEILDVNQKFAGTDLILSKNLRAEIEKKAGKGVNRETLKDAVLTAFVLETFRRNQAFFDIANLSLESYRTANDIIKRNTITSTGNLFRSDDEAQAYITSKGRLLEAAYENNTGKPVMQRSYTGKLRTAILKEMTLNEKDINSEWYDLAEKAFKAEGLDQKQIDSVLEAYRNMDEADAQAYITMDTYRQLSMASDEWTSEQEYMYQRMVSGLTINNPQQYFPVRKYQYTGALLNAKAPLQALHKYSLFPLVPSVIAGTNLEQLNNSMMEAGIDYVTYETGSKAARVGQPVEAFVIDAETGNRTVPENIVQSLKENMNLIHVNFLKDQLRINSQFKGSSTFSTQFRKLLSDGIYENGNAINKELDKASKAFLDNIDKLIRFETEALRKEIDTKSKLISLIKRELQNRDVADYKIEAIDVDRKGNLKYNLDALPAAGEMEKILNAVVNRRLIRAKLPGESLVQVASTGLEKVNSSNDLRFYEPGKAAQVKIALQGDFRKLLLMTDPEGGPIGSLTRLNELLKDEAWVEKNRKLITITGVRIPVQGLNSMELYEVAEFLAPAAGNVIVVPTEMVAKSGSDFDIDKLTMYYPTIYAGKKSTGKTEQLLDDTFINLLFDSLGETEAPITELEKSEYTVRLDNKGSNKFKNNIISQAREILLHPANFTKLIRPIATDLVKENSEAFNELVDEEADISKSEVFNYSYNLKKQQENSVGKKALGISAKGNTYNTMFQKVSNGLAPAFAYAPSTAKDFIEFYGSQFAPIEVANSYNSTASNPVKFAKLDINDINLPFGKIGDLKDSENINLKSDIISQIVNGHVDMANDSWIANIGADNVMTPYLLNLIDMGVNYDYAVRFLNNNYIREYFDRLIANQGQFNLAIGGQTFADYSIILDMLKAHNLEAYDIITVSDTKRPSTKDLLELISELSTKDSKLNIAKDSITPLYEFIKLVYYFKPLKSIRLATDLDTKKAASISDSVNESELVESLLMNPVTGSLVDELLENNVLGTFLDVKTFQRTAFKDLFGFRSDALFNKFLRQSLNRNEDVKYDTEKRNEASKRYVNGFITHLLNSKRFNLTSSNFNKVKTYKGLPVNFVSLTEEVGKQAFASKDGVINIDLAKINAGAQTVMSKYNLTYSQFLSFVLENQYLVATTNLETSEATSQAIYNLNIPQHLTDFTNPNSIAQKFTEMTLDADAIEALADFTVVEDMIVYDYKGGKMVGIKTDKGNVEDFERYHAEIKLLQESTNELVREFFTRLPEAVVAVEGFNGGRLSLLDVIPFDSISARADNAVREYIKSTAEQKEAVLTAYNSGILYTQTSPGEIEVKSEATTELKTDEEVEEFIKKCKV